MASITDLPEHLFLVVLSLLPFLDAVRLCSLSKQWLHLWGHCKTIELDRSRFTNQAREYCRTLGVRRYFAAHVRRMLPLFVVPEIELIKLRLPIEFNNSRDQNFLDRFLGFAAEKKVKELHLDFFTEETLHTFYHCCLRTAESHPSVLNITESLYQATCLRLLRLTCCGLKDFNFGQEKIFMQLTSLYLAGMFMTSHIVVNIGFCCPVLEEVSIVDCRIDDQHLPFNASWSKLRRLVVKGGPSLVGLDLSAPNVQYLEMSVFIWDINLGNMKNLDEAVFNLKNQSGYSHWDIDLIDILDGLQWVKMLTVTHGFIEALPYNGEHFQLNNVVINLEDPYADPNYEELPMIMENLVHLKASTTLEGSALRGALVILRSSPKLKRIWIETPFGNDIDELTQLPPYHRKLRHTYRPPRSPFTALEEVKIEGFIGSNDQMNFLEFLLRYAVSLTKVFIVFPNTTAMPNDSIATLTKWTMAELNKMERYVSATDVEIVFQADDIKLCMPLQALNIKCVPKKKAVVKRT